MQGLEGSFRDLAPCLAAEQAHDELADRVELDERTLRAEVIAQQTVAFRWDPRALIWPKGKLHNAGMLYLDEEQKKNIRMACTIRSGSGRASGTHALDDDNRIHGAGAGAGDGFVRQTISPKQKPGKVHVNVPQPRLRWLSPSSRQIEPVFRRWRYAFDFYRLSEGLARL